MTSSDKLLFVADQSEKQRKCIKYRYQAHMSDFQDKQIRRKNQSEKIDRIYTSRGEFLAFASIPNFRILSGEFNFPAHRRFCFRSLTHFWELPILEKRWLIFRQSQNHIQDSWEHGLICTRRVFRGWKLQRQMLFFCTKERGKNLFKSCFSCLFLAFRINWFSKRQHTLKLGSR